MDEARQTRPAPTIGLAFRFPLLAKEGQEPCGLWRLAHEAFEPFYLSGPGLSIHPLRNIEGWG